MLAHKKFYTFPRYSQDGSVSTNGRLYSLLSLVHQESRLVRRSDALSWEAKAQKDIIPDFDVIEKELKELRQFTWGWLTTALKDCAVL